ncbi:DUF2270 domain-containing protein [Halorubrum lacusprofundi]|jgi:uncharacterized membrane protein|uniref:DUF2270 domain-containing protein n=1 Tax=Halorubrum lacusprofundi (strain ATCC 49239 / DSM 5036 / JCM 8891 / ACAM 34) TaxID=416348 RepID=B9LQD4_HALLT|nr:DUF2270 domain-containing protein [Halorubrum lacusprofundi]ACM57555.1 conserved hypothetical protein [Halorubrum lacusprofundi ATCC 49239]MCG1005848.1 DUF2270 domain-containing protein [Halorubrum lacusprofundi]
MSDPSADFDPESREEREVAAEAAGDRSELLSLMAHTYRGELGRAASWRTRIDRTTNWAVVLTASLLTWTFSNESRPHYVLLIGLVMLTVFLSIEARRYRIYDVWRSRVRILEENVFANALDPEGVEQSNWRGLLSTDLRKPTIKTPAVEAVSRRLRRVYTPLFTVLIAAWIVRLTVFTPPESGVVATASVGAIPGLIILAGVACFYIVVLGLSLRTRPRQAKGELQSTDRSEEWK